MSKRELLIALGVAAAFVLAIVNIKVMAVDWQRGDTALFLQLAENVAQRGEPISQVFANTQAFLEGKTLWAPVDQVASSPLAPPTVDERNMLPFHAYSTLYITGALTRVLPSNIVVFTQMVVSFIGLALLCYVLLRRAKISITAALAFSLLVVSHPAWSESLLEGQPYPDRLFLLLGFAFMYLVTRPMGSRLWLITLALLCASINERAAVVAGAFTLFYTFAFRQEHTHDRNFRLALGACLFLFGNIVIKFFLHNAEYGSFLPTTSAQLWANLTSPYLLPKLELFALVNLPFLILAFFEWKMALIAIVLMLPNVIGNIGGGEKVGWATAYHTYYQPSLVLAAFVGYQRLYQLAQLKKRQWQVAPLLGAFVAYLCMLSPIDAAPIQFGTAYVHYHFIPTLLADGSKYFGDDGRAINLTIHQMHAAVPEHTTISTVEAGMPIFYKHDVIRVFPIDLERADYALMSYEETPTASTRYFGAVSFLGQVQQKRLDTLILHRMQSDGYDFDHARKFPLLGLALVRRLPGQASGHYLGDSRND